MKFTILNMELPLREDNKINCDINFNMKKNKIQVSNIQYNMLFLLKRKTYNTTKNRLIPSKSGL
jgi:hypothetical protein